MASESDIALLEKKRLDRAVLTDALTSLADIQNNGPAGLDVLIKLPNNTVFSLGSLKERLSTNGPQEDAAVQDIIDAVVTAVGSPAVAGSISKAVADLDIAYGADIAAE